MEDADLAAIRNKRMQELQMKAGDPNQAKQQAEAKQKYDEQLNGMLTQILTQDARARLNSIALVKPEKAKQLEGMLINMARSGQLGEKMTEQQLVKVLEQINDKKQRTKVKFERRRVMDSDDSD
ncbi:programmed cell death protein 5-like [Styela clava]|uniref:programmed cell death protein 5-like n=1 Tax=Styela clava TaxID=7725 RepID=UPI00193A383A|nr:programmed cell death protein 5-like [Styela clava]